MSISGLASRYPQPALVWIGSASLLLGALVFFVSASIAASLAVMICSMAVGLGLYKPEFLLLALFVWLPFLGFLRRVPSLSVESTAINPLLIVGPVASMVLLLVALRAGIGKMSGLSAAVLAFNLVTLLSAFNPEQGNIKIGITGVAVVLIPVLWFWIGRALNGQELLNRMLRLIALVALATSSYGLWQTFIGFPSWDQIWIKEKGYAALNVQGTTRPFSTFSNAAEYAAFCGIGIVVLCTAKKEALKWQFRLCALALLAAALFLIATRGAVILTILAMAVTWTTRRGIGLVKAGALLAIAALTVSISLQLLTRVDFDNPRTAALIRHQLGGIGNPFDPTKSTLVIHLRMAASGVSEAFSRPFGSGVGTITIAGLKLGGETIDTEVDFSNAAVGMGVPGFVLFSYIAVAGSFLAYRTAQEERTFVALAAVGVLVVTAFHWLTGGQYSVAPLPWLFLGWLDRRATDESLSNETSSMVSDGASGGPLDSPQDEPTHPNKATKNSNLRAPREGDSAEEAQPPSGRKA